MKENGKTMFWCQNPEESTHFADADRKNQPTVPSGKVKDCNVNFVMEKRTIQVQRRVNVYWRFCSRQTRRRRQLPLRQRRCLQGQLEEPWSAWLWYHDKKKDGSIFSGIWEFGALKQRSYETEAPANLSKEQAGNAKNNETEIYAVVVGLPPTTIWLHCGIRMTMPTICMHSEKPRGRCYTR